MSDKPVEMTDAKFEEEVIKSETPVLVDFWAPWCAPCRMVAPVLEELADAHKGKVKICKLNVDENPVTAQNFEIRAIPTLLLFKGGRPAARMVGVRPKEEIEKEIEAAIK
jgi:thioredoxin 1